MESIHIPEWYGGKLDRVLKRSYEGPCGPCLVHMDT